MTQTELMNLITSNVPDNDTQFITPSRMREVLVAMVETEFERIKAPITYTVVGSESITLMAGQRLDAIVADPDGSDSFKVGLTVGGGELLDTDLGGQLTFIRMDYNTPTNIMIYFTGNCNVTVYKSER